MNDLFDQNHTLDTIATLYELSLGIGTSLDLKENCDYFFSRLLSRRNLSVCALFINGNLRHLDTDHRSSPSATNYFCANVHPAPAAADFKVMDDSCEVVQRLKTQAFFSMDLTELMGHGHAAEPDPAFIGEASIFRLSRIGFVVCTKVGKTELEENWRLNQFAEIFEKFGNSVAACLDHERLIRETATRIELQERLARSERMESLGVLAGGVAHDLNNILGPLVAYPELIMDQIPHHSPIRGDLKQIESSALQAADVIKDLMTLARRGRQFNEVINLSKTIKDFTSSPTFLSMLKDYPKVTLGCKVDTAAKINGSQSALSRVLMNLVANACESLEGQGRVEVEVFDRTLKEPTHGYETLAPGDYGIIRVSDTGCGIQSEDLSRIFEPFFSKKGMGKRSGTGLGLAIVYGIVKDNGGFVDVKTSSSGTTFSLYLPDLIHAASAAAQPPLDLRKTVLVVDDNAQQREVALRILRDDGFIVQEAASTESAMAVVAESRPSVVVLDMVLGSKDGVDLYRDLLQLIPDLLCVFISGFSQPERVQEGLRLGAHSFLRKPFAAGELRNCVRAVLSESRQQSIAGLSQEPLPKKFHPTHTGPINQASVLQLNQPD